MENLEVKKEGVIQESDSPLSKLKEIHNRFENLKMTKTLFKSISEAAELQFKFNGACKILESAISAKNSIAKEALDKLEKLEDYLKQITDASNKNKTDNNLEAMNKFKELVNHIWGEFSIVVSQDKKEKSEKN